MVHREALRDPVVVTDRRLVVNDLLEDGEPAGLDLADGAQPIARRAFPDEATRCDAGPVAHGLVVRDALEHELDRRLDVELLRYVSLAHAALLE
jgi:hypothetical protein